MNELQDYLARTKNQREKSKKLANSIIETNLTVGDNLSHNNLKLETNFPSLSPKRLHFFEENINEKLKEIYNPTYQSSVASRKLFLKLKKSEERFKLIYMNKKGMKVSRPKIMMPFTKSRCENTVKSGILGGKYLSSDSKTRSNNTMKKPNYSRSKSDLKKLYLIPILKKKIE